MPSISDRFKDLKNSILGTTTAKIDAQLDDAVKDIVAYKSQAGRKGYIELVRSLISKSADVSLSGQGGVFGQGATPAAFGQGGRIMRYKMYEAITANINYCSRALDVLVDNVISPDDITKSSLEVKPENYLEDEVSMDSQVRTIKKIIESLKLESKLNLIVRTTLELGDFFCEIGDEKTALTSRSVLSESSYDDYIGQLLKEGIRENITYKDYHIVLDYSTFMEAKRKPAKKKAAPKKKTASKKEDENISVKRLNLIFHEPQFIVKLQSSLFPICFGYLVFPKVSITNAATMEDDALNTICTNILKNLIQKIPQAQEFANDNDLKDILGAMLKHSDPNKVMDIRYVPTDNMVHFCRPSVKHFPYGSSIFEPCQFTAKVLMALETALAIQRLSRSTEKRKIGVEIGLPRDARKAVENLKEEFRKRKVSLDSFGSIDTIPSMITTFEDIYIPQKDGKSYVDISTFSEGNVDVRNKVEELKFLRDQLVSSLGVPPSFIGIEENLSNKSALSEENILFARTIINHQKFLTHQISELIEKVMLRADPEKALTLLNNRVTVSLPVPRSLQFEREARYMSEFANLVETLDRIGINKAYSRKKYLSQIDWEEVKKYSIDDKIDKGLDPEKKKEDDDGMGGMSGGMGGF